jgi:hypothetical protein
MHDQVACRFWSRVLKTDNCWEWQGCPNSEGYGYVKVNKRGWLAHRFAYVLTYGPIPGGLKVRHKCDNPICVRPSHLLLGTQKDNMQDCHRRGRAYIGPRGPTKLTPAQRRTIHRRANAGENTYDLGREFGISQPRVSQIKNHLYATA